MKKMKRFVSLMTVMAMLAASCVFAVSVYAEEAETLPSVEVTQADLLTVEKLEAFGAITNAYEDIGMYPTRRQMVDIIMTYLRMQGSNVDVATSPFVDVPLTDPSIGNITALYNSGVITGDENLKFHPDAYLTYDEAIVFVVNAVGYKAFAAREGGYPTGYHRIAIKYDMLEDLKFNSGKEYIPLCDVYKLLDSALDVGGIVLQTYSDGSVDYKVSNKETFLSDMYNITKYKGIVTGSEYTKLDSHLSNLTDEQIEINGVVYDTPGYVYGTSLGRAVFYYVRKNHDGEYDIAYVEENDKLNNVVKVTSKNLDKDKTAGSSDRIYYYDEEEKERHISHIGVVDVIKNGKSFNYGRIADALPTYGYIEALDNTGDEVADVIFVYEYQDIVVASVDEYDETIKAMYTNEEFQLDMQSDIINIRLMPDNKKLSLGNLKQWDVVSIMKTTTTPQLFTAYVSRNTISGMVEEITNERKMLINGEYYECAAAYGDIPTIDVGTSALFYLDFNGKIVSAEKGKATVSEESNEKYAVVTGLDYDVNSATSAMKVKLYTQDGVFLEAPLSNKVKIDNVPYSPTGSDMDEVLRILSHDTTNAQGNYAVDAPYVVRYMLDGDGKVSYLDTDANGGKLRAFANAPESTQAVHTEFMARSGGIMQVKSMDGAVDPISGDATMVTRYASYIPNSVWVFTVPNDGELDVVEEYAVSRSIKTSKYYCCGNGHNAIHVHPIAGFMMYDLGENETNTVDVIMVKGGGTSTAISESSSLNVVTRLSNTTDADGVETMKIYMNETASAIAAEKVTITGLVQQADVPGAELYKHITSGMVISYGMDEDGQVDTIKVIAKYNGPNNVDVYTSDMTSNLAGATEGHGKVAGSVSYNDTDKSLMNIIPSTGSIANVLVNAANANVIVYRPGTGTIKATATSEKVSSVTAGDYVVVRTTNYFNVNEIIVFKN